MCHISTCILSLLQPTYSITYKHHNITLVIFLYLLNRQRILILYSLPLFPYEITKKLHTSSTHYVITLLSSFVKNGILDRMVLILELIWLKVAWGISDRYIVSHHLYLVISSFLPMKFLSSICTIQNIDTKS